MLLPRASLLHDPTSFALQANQDVVRCGGFVERAAQGVPPILQVVALWEEPCWGGGVVHMALARQMYRANETVFGSREPPNVVELFSSQHMQFGVPLSELTRAVDVVVRAPGGGAPAAGGYVCLYEYDHMHMSLRGLAKL